VVSKNSLVHLKYILIEPIPEIIGTET
jgi:hypothetical protein